MSSKAYKQVAPAISAPALMTQGMLIPNISEVVLVCLRPKDGAIQTLLRDCRSSSACPACGTVSRRIHSRYLRKVADMPWEKLPVLILLETRKFFCTQQSCRATVFTEPLPGTVARYARRTVRLAEALDWITLAVGGCAGARLVRRLPVSPDATIELSLQLDCIRRTN